MGKKAVLVAALIAALAGAVLFATHRTDAAGPGEARLTIGALPGPATRDDDLLQWAELVLSGRCMAAHGYAFAVDWAVDTSVPDFDAMPYGTTDAAIAGQYGYGIGPSRRSSGDVLHTDPNRAYAASLNRRQRWAYTEMMFGSDADHIDVRTDDGIVTSTNRGGCLSAARAELYGGLDRWVALDVWITSLDSVIVPEVTADPAYRKALGQWRACMDRLGRPAEDPAASRSAAALAYETSPYAQAWPAERAAATADARCSAESQLFVTAQRLHAQLVARVARDRAADVADYQARKAKAVQRARDLLTELAPSPGADHH